MLEPPRPSGGGSDDSVRGGDTSSRRWPRCWLWVSHHSYPKVDTKNAALRGQKTVTSTSVGPAEYYELSSDDDRPTAGTRLPSMLEQWPQGKVERHSGIGYELVQALDAPVLQMVGQSLDVFQFFATRLPVVAEQVIDVPKISFKDIPTRHSCRKPQLAEQLVEVPTVLSLPLLQQQIAEQTVDIPIHGGGLQGLRPGQGSTASSSSFSLSSAVLDDADEALEGIFRTFPRKKKKCKGRGAGECAHVSSSTLSAHLMAAPVSAWIADNGDTWKMVHSASVGTCWVNTITYDPQWDSPWEHFPATASPGFSVLGTAVVGAWQSTFLRSCSPCSSFSPIVMGATPVAPLWTSLCHAALYRRLLATLGLTVNTSTASASCGFRKNFIFLRDGVLGL